jgi:hypothetical protein
MEAGSLPCSQNLTILFYSETDGSSPHPLILIIYDPFQYYFPFTPRSLTLREEHRLRVCENKVLRRIFGLNRDEVTGGLGKLHNEELHNLYSFASIIRKIKSRSIRWEWHTEPMVEEIISYTILMVKPEEMRPLRRPRLGGRTIIKWILEG